jgi:hypothetical protein
VGQNNMKFFLQFLLYVGLGGIHAGGMLVYRLVYCIRNPRMVWCGPGGGGGGSAIGWAGGTFPFPAQPRPLCVLLCEVPARKAHPLASPAPSPPPPPPQGPPVHPWFLFHAVWFGGQCAAVSTLSLVLCICGGILAILFVCFVIAMYCDQHEGMTTDTTGIEARIGWDEVDVRMRGKKGQA